MENAVAYCRCNVTVRTYHGSMLVLLLSLISLAYFASRRGDWKGLSETVSLVTNVAPHCVASCFIYHLDLQAQPTAKLSLKDLMYARAWCYYPYMALFAGQPAASCVLFVGYGNKSAEYFSGYCSSFPCMCLCVCIPVCCYCCSMFAYSIYHLSLLCLSINGIARVHRKFI